MPAEGAHPDLKIGWVRLMLAYISETNVTEAIR